MSKKKADKDFKWFTKTKNDDSNSQEEKKEEKPAQKLTGRDKFPPLPNGLSSNRPH